MKRKIIYRENCLVEMFNEVSWMHLSESFEKKERKLALKVELKHMIEWKNTWCLYHLLFYLGR